MKVRNLRDQEVVVAAAGHPPITAEAGGEIEVADDLGKSLLEQPDRWAAAGARKTKAVDDGEEATR